MVNETINQSISSSIGEYVVITPLHSETDTETEPKTCRCARRDVKADASVVFCDYIVQFRPGFRWVSLHAVFFIFRFFFRAQITWIISEFDTLRIEAIIASEG